MIGTLQPGRFEPLSDRVLAGEPVSTAEASEILDTTDSELFELLGAAYKVRSAHFGNRVHIHVLENAKLGACPEDCSFCSQSSAHGSPGGEAPISDIDDLVAQARSAAAAGAKRYCMVTATRGPAPRDLDVICAAAEAIKAELDIELCASLGLLTESKARRLAESGIDRFNHNLETSERYFDKVVTTHTFADRVETVKLARAAGMTICSGGIAGLGESRADLIDLCFALRELEADSVPLNFLDPRPGTPLASLSRLSPTDALRALCLFRFVHPRADLRVAGGREVTLRSFQPLSLFPANSIFTAGYLTTDGNRPNDDHQMIRDWGFELEASDQVLAMTETRSNNRATAAPLPVIV